MRFVIQNRTFRGVVQPALIALAGAVVVCMMPAGRGRAQSCWDWYKAPGGGGRTCANGPCGVGGSSCATQACGMTTEGSWPNITYVMACPSGASQQQAVNANSQINDCWNYQTGSMNCTCDGPTTWCTQSFACGSGSCSFTGFGYVCPAPGAGAQGSNVCGLSDCSLSGGPCPPGS